MSPELHRFTSIAAGDLIIVNKRINMGPDCSIEPGVICLVIDVSVRDHVLGPCTCFMLLASSDIYLFTDGTLNWFILQGKISVLGDSHEGM